MKLIIDGKDVSGYIKEGGLQFRRNDIDSKNSGRTAMDGKMHRARVAIKYRIDVSCRSLTQAESETLLALIEPQFVTVQTTSPRHGNVTWKMYSNNVPTTQYATMPDGSTLWSGISFPLIQE